MNRIIGFAFFLLLLAAVAFFTLKHLKPIADSNADTPLAGTDWRPVSIGDRIVPGDTRLHLRFEVDGKLNGNGGCNSFFGTYTLDGSDMDIGPIGATRMACPEPQMDLEARFFHALESAESFVTRRNHLLLSDSNGVELAVFAEADPATTERP
ncbi:MAG: META domain-containing protein [Woeseiaceae bacterium]|nr:META domain-containing protein [Woeseiaceae bacterium]